MKVKRKIISVVMALTLLSLGVRVSADDTNPEVWDGVYDGYDLTSKMIDTIYSGDNEICWGYFEDENGLYFLQSFDIRKSRLLYGKIKVPDKINGNEMHYISGSCYAGEFDLNPENKYMKCVDNVIFSKDGERLMAYAKYDKRVEYTIPDGTKTIASEAFFGCENLINITIPDSVCEMESYVFFDLDNIISIDIPSKIKNIPRGCFCSDGNLSSVNINEDSELEKVEYHAFEDCENLKELYLPSFNIQIDKEAFGYKPAIQLKSYVQPTVTTNKNILSWEEIPKTSYYEIYQKLNSGEYKLLGKTKSTSHSFATLKSGSEYTFAVKPIAVIPAANYDKKEDEGYFPETFTIEGTMSEDIVMKG